MRKKFLMLLPVLLILITGCSAEYKLNIKSDYDVSENLTINNINFTENQKKIYETNGITKNINDGCFIDYDVEPSVGDSIKNSDEYYKLTFENRIANAKGSIYLDNLKNSRIANSFFGKINVSNDEQQYLIYGYDGFEGFIMYPELSDVTIKIKVHNKVIDHDADKVIGNTYYWNFNKNTSNKKTLYIRVNKLEKAIPEKISINGIIIVIIILMIVVLLIVKYLISLKRRNNKI